MSAPPTGAAVITTSGFTTLLQEIIAGGRRCPLREDGTSACGSREPFLFLGAERGHARRTNYSARIFRPACDGIYPAEKRRKDYQTRPWRVHCSSDEPFSGIPVPTGGRSRAKAERMAECSWAALMPGLGPHGLRHGNQTAMRRDRVPRVLRRQRLGHGRSGDIADHYTHIADEMVEELLDRQTERWEAAVASRARIDEVRGRVAHSAVPALDSGREPCGSAPTNRAPTCAPISAPQRSLRERATR